MDLGVLNGRAGINLLMKNMFHAYGERDIADHNFEKKNLQMFIKSIRCGGNMVKLIPKSKRRQGDEERRKERN